MSVPIRARINSKTKIDVLIPAIEKDLVTLPYVIDAVRKQVKHPIGQIMIVSPDRPRMRNLCRRKGCRFVNENSVLPITKRNIRYRSKKWERSGWLFQQLLKMSGDNLGNSNYFLAIDADTVLIRPHVFRIGAKTLFYCRNWSQPEYFKTYRKLLGRKAASPSSFVTHYMLFEKSKLRRLKRVIAAKHRMSWYAAILKKMDRTKQFAFSEFETYGNFLYANNPSGVLLRKALNKSLSTNIAQLSPGRRKTLARKYRSLSFHKRKGYARSKKR
ncbi:hypothetical protein GZH47_15340 [Paenibacillus rhizovicinus]|uniref:Glycosyltransferase family 2 protein n=1 Tax=Paenibacillus rhizovicinus TaxID=2704463 RepID=A0A6C0P1E1_9BACL|nr:DUF6492 family protein [Paenibacillus rhizovicinus]QHW32046.1 hypothetical protein GZH47_15340 [Paenibacillus rhizovicinus]